jgi:multiple sugar transport system ATP-binding protein
VNDVPPKDRDIAMVFQNYALYPHMNVHQNMSFGLRLRKTPRAEIERRVGDAAKLLQIDHLLERRPRELSGGQRQRVALGRAIVREPKVFLMDEPLSNLDAKLRVEMRASISKLHRRLGVTTVYVTHDQVEAMTMGTRIVVMKDGLIQQVDSPINLYDKPVNKFVAGFIGSPAMNFMIGTAENGRIVSPQFDLKPGGELSQKLAAQRGKKVYVGIRPENLGLRGSTAIAEGDNIIKATVEVVEPLGAETHILASVGGDQSIVAKVDAARAGQCGRRDRAPRRPQLPARVRPGDRGQPPLRLNVARRAAAGATPPPGARTRLPGGVRLPVVLAALNQVDKWYGEQTVLEGVTLELREGERLALIGRNGAGKTTVLRLFAATEPPDGGVYRRPGVSVGVLDQAPTFPRARP